MCPYSKPENTRPVTANKPFQFLAKLVLISLSLVQMANLSNKIPANLELRKLFIFIRYVKKTCNIRCLQKIPENTHIQTHTDTQT